MKNYSFERVPGAENGEQVEIHRKRHGFRLGTKLLCLIMAFLFWLIVANVSLLREETGDMADQSLQISQADRIETTTASSI